MARTLKAGELRVSWQRVPTATLGPEPLFAEAFVTVIVDDGETPIVRQVRPTTTEVLVDGVARGRDLEIAAAVTRRYHLLSEISRLRLRATQTRSWDRTRPDTGTTTVPPTGPPPTRPFSLLPAPQPSVAARYNLSYWIGNDGNLEIEDDIEGKYIGPDPGDRTPPSGMFKSVGSGKYHGCAVKQSDDTVECWGTPRWWLDFTVPQDLGPVTMLNVGVFLNCAVKKEDSTVQCWAYDRHDLLTLVPGGQFHSVSGGQHHTCGLRPDGQVECWGRNNYGQTDVPVNLGPFRALAAGNYHNCAIRQDDTVACWGWE